MNSKSLTSNSKINFKYFSTLMLNGKLPYLLLALIIWIIYFETIDFTFSPLDDPGIIEGRISYLMDFSNLFDVLTTPLEMASATFFYRPILELTFMIDAAMGQGAPWAFHFSNLLFHIITAILFHYFLLLIGTRRITAFTLALIFAVHPTNVSIVSWIPARNDSLLAMLLLSSLISYNRFVQFQSNKHLIIHIGIIAISIFTKENAILIPAILISFHFLILKSHKSILQKPFVGWILIFSMWFIIRQLVFIESDSTLAFKDLGEIILNTPGALVLYMGKMIFPFNQSLMPNIADTPIIPNILMSLLLVAILSFAGTKDRNTVLFGVIVSLSMISIPLIWGTVFGMSNAYEHRIYLPLIGMFISLSRLTISNFIRSSIVISSLIVFIVSFSMISHSRTKVYADKQTFTENLVIESPSLWQTHATRAGYLSDNHFPYLAIDSYTMALTLTNEPNPVKLYYLRGIQYQTVMDYQNALIDYSITSNMDPKFSDVYHNRGLIYLELQQVNEAIAEMTIAIGLESEKSEYYMGRGNCYLKSLEYKLASDDFSSALLIVPEDVEILTNRCVAYYFLEDYESSYQDLRKIEYLGREVNPDLKGKLLKKYNNLDR
jgi:protein O-mannosyl-transferase